ncbi:hypothetical protein DCS_02568 [Drechmeria coniospora]|uniref:Uncharacterized protein n=1 Tax=Drechmeria coniospora TaxID=98403 RepID=A0A151GWD9_DRECN|nr:hypothetical protein DCS_02568 [Drechmeria coniospora]KYK61426.1 hypothetical protein DCS_02568 [Drechmeria coniospora]ODA81189.1 hypothetical protein RJ55_04153 [Drechmeria coniospora]
MAQQPSTPVKVPSSAANHTPATLDPDLRSQINTVLLRDGHVAKIQEALLHTLNSHSSNWPTAVQSHAIALLRSGEETTYPGLLKRVLEDVRADSTSSFSAFPSTTAASSKNGAKAPNGGLAKKPNGIDAGTDRPNLALPEDVVEEALRATKESLLAVCEIEDGGS